LRKLVFAVGGAVIGIVIGFVAVAGLIVAIRFGGEMTGVAAVDLGLFIGAPIGGIAFASIGLWLARTRRLRD
jgi:hypothetical protein